MAFMESASSVVAVFGYAHVVAADAAFTEKIVSEPVPEIGWISFAYYSCVEWGVNVHFEFSSVGHLQIAYLIENAFVFIGSGRQVRHVSACSSNWYKIVVNHHSGTVFRRELRRMFHVFNIVLCHVVTMQSSMPFSESFLIAKSAL